MTVKMQKGTPTIQQEEEPRICNFKGKTKLKEDCVEFRTSIVHMKRKRAYERK